MKTKKEEFIKNYTPESMGFAEGFICMRIPKRVGYYMEVDEGKAKRIVKRLINEGRDIEEAVLGLDGDWIENSGTIYNGEFHKYEAWDNSAWATPILMVFFNDGPSETYDCFKWKKVK